MHSLDTKQLTLVAWSVAKLGNAGSHEGALLDAVANESIQQAEHFSPLVRHAHGGAGLFCTSLVVFAINGAHLICVPHLIYPRRGWQTWCGALADYIILQMRWLLPSCRR